MSKSWEGGSTRAWRRTRAAVLADPRWQGRCQLKLPGCTTVATHVHHTLGREVAGDNREHLLPACAHCNLATGDPRRHDPAPEPRTRW